MDSSSDDYPVFTDSEVMQVLTETRDIRVEEELTRPRVEVWPDDDWQQWITSHESRRKSLICSLRSMRASPFCALGWH
jgi:hypothetical protein